MEMDITLLEKQVKSYNKKGWDTVYSAYLKLKILRESLIQQ